MSITSYELYHGDCLDILPTLDAQSVDAAICDPPYGTTACTWDSVIPFEPMWKELKRIIKPRGAIVLFGSQPFTSALVMSNPRMFRYSLVWDKVAPSSGLNARIQPLPCHEDMLVFYKNTPTYNPQMSKGHAWHRGGQKRIGAFTNYAAQVGAVQLRANTSDVSDLKFPKSIIQISTADKNGATHPTQKPLALLEYLVKTYTNEGDTVLDFTMGSGTTGHACGNLGRRFVGIEKDEHYFNVAAERIATAYAPLRAMQVAV